MTKNIPRRTFLKGFGAAVSLPLLESMAPIKAVANTAGEAPVRMAFMFVPNGIHMEEWKPNTEGAHYCLLYTSPSPRDVEESRMPSSA